MFIKGKKLNPKGAKDFLAQKICETANRNEISFDDLERQMLYWSSDQEEDFLELGKIFSKKHKDEEFEKKVRELIRKSYEYDADFYPEDLKRYKQAYKVLSQGDHYLSIMLEDAVGYKFNLFGRLGFGKESKSVGDYLKLIFAAFVFGIGFICIMFAVEAGYGFLVWTAISFVLAVLVFFEHYLSFFGLRVGVTASLILFFGWITSYWAANHFDFFGSNPIKSAFGISLMLFFALEMGLVKYR